MNKPSIITAGQSLNFAAPVFDLIENVCSFGIIKRSFKKLAVLAHPGQGDSILDVGCGTGTLLIIIKKMYGESLLAAGIDPAQKLLNIARRKGDREGVHVDFQIGVIEKLPFSEEYFHHVFCTFVLHHLPFHLKVEGLKNILKVLRPGGNLWVVDYAKPDTVLRKIARFFYYVQTSIIEHGEFLMRGGLPSLMKDIGYEDVHVVGRFTPLICSIYYGKKPQS